MLREGNVYHISDDYFALLEQHNLSEYLMKNKENSVSRPTYYCFKDGNSDLLWMVPMSSRYDKFERIRNGIIAKRGKCDTIVLGEYGGQKAAFLIQNMFPILPRFISHEHTIRGNIVPVHSAIAKEVDRKAERAIFLLEKRKVKIVFPDIHGIKTLLIGILKKELETERKFTHEDKPPLKDRLEEAGKLSGHSVRKPLADKPPKL
jgi:hypothetical protein